jgi:Replication protein C N-terminal domain
VVHKWQIFRAICTARPRLGVSERALAVLNALLSFYPDTTLSGDDELIVFPSNEQLCLRTHGMPASTLRRLLAVLVDAGPLIAITKPSSSFIALSTTNPRGISSETSNPCIALIPSPNQSQTGASISSNMSQTPFCSPIRGAVSAPIDTTPRAAHVERSFNQIEARQALRGHLQ